MLIVSPLPPSTKHADSIDLELEVDPLNVDHFSCTPLVRELRTTALLYSMSEENYSSLTLFVSLPSRCGHAHWVTWRQQSSYTNGTDVLWPSQILWDASPFRLLDPVAIPNWLNVWNNFRGKNSSPWLLYHPHIACPSPQPLIPPPQTAGWSTGQTAAA